MNSVAGGHAVLAGGVALVATPLQEKNGAKDSPDAAYKNWMQWTVDADPQWTRFYVEHSRAMIYDWVTAMGVEFVRVGGGFTRSGSFR
jgi:predicted oxidoreductase